MGVFLSATAWDSLIQELETKETYEDLLVAEGEADRGEVSDHEDFLKEVKAHRKARTRKSQRLAV